ncbi:MAG: hypothetical protein IJ665_05150 [Phocaeicola sp.]|nr:hypothetical protein [Phocaeicola sp.]
MKKSLSIYITAFVLFICCDTVFAKKSFVGRKFNWTCQDTVDDATQVVSYMPMIQQALLDLADWAEKGIEPSKTTTYAIEDSQVVIPADAADRGGVQPSVDLTIDGKKRFEAKIDEEVVVHVVANCPKGTGRIVRAELCLGEPFDLYSRGPKGNAAVLIAPPAKYVDIDLSHARMGRK